MIKFLKWELSGNGIQSYKQNLFIYIIGIGLGVAPLFFYKNFSVILPIITALYLFYEKRVSLLNINTTPPFVFSFLLILLSGISIIWVEDKFVAVKTLFEASLTYVSAVLLISGVKDANERHIHICKKILYIAGIAFILLYSLQAYGKIVDLHGTIRTFKSLRMIKPTGSIVGLFLFTACTWLWVDGKRTLASLVYILLLLAIYLSKCQTAFLAVLMAMPVYGLSVLYPMLVTRLLMIVSFSWLIFSPILYAYILTPAKIHKIPFLSSIVNNSLNIRIFVWEWYAKKFLHDGWLGFGLESGRFARRIKPEVVDGVKMTIHAHNGSLQAFYELGLLGGILFALFIASLFWVVMKSVKDKLSVAVCNATIIYALIEAQVTHNLWRNYWLSVITIASAYLILFIKFREAQQRVGGDH